MRFCRFKLCDSNFQRCSDVLACMCHWVWYFRSCISTGVIILANSLLSFVYFVIWNRIGILAWNQFLWFVLGNSFPEHPLAHFSDVQRISRIYSSVLAFMVDRKFTVNQPQDVLWWIQLCWVHKLVIYLLMCWEWFLTHFSTWMFAWFEMVYCC
jgi:hypothetical protein